MSDFVKDIVNEVITHGNQSAPGQLYRPNYQQMKKKKGLTVYEVFPEKKEADSVSALYAAVGKETMRAEPPHPAKTASAACCMRCGRADRNPCFVQISMKDRKIKQLLGFPYGSFDEGCLGYAEKSNMRQLFKLDELLEENQGIDYQLDWSLEPEMPFALRAAGSREAMEAVVKGMNGEDLLKPGICITEKPGSLLQKKLNIPSRAVASVEGIPYMRLLPQAIAYLQSHSEAMLEIKTYGMYLLISGDIQTVKEAVEEIYKS